MNKKFIIALMWIRYEYPDVTLREFDKVLARGV